MHRSEGPLRYMAVDDNHLASLLVSAIAALQTKQTNGGKAMGDPLCANRGFSPAPVFLVAKNFGTINTSDSLATRQKKSVSCIISALYHLAHYTHQSSAKTAPLSLAAVVFFCRLDAVLQHPREAPTWLNKLSVSYRPTRESAALAADAADQFGNLTVNFFKTKLDLQSERHIGCILFLVRSFLRLLPPDCLRFQVYCRISTLFLNRRTNKQLRRRN